jgi:selenocysteine lyase/cysteine desulfurase
VSLSKPLNKYFDHTILKADASTTQIEELCQEALKYDFFSVCVNSCNVALASEMLKGSDVKIAAVVGFPLGACTTATKAFETEECCKDGATEIDMETLQLDVLCFSGHKKLLGPYGTGGLCLRKGLELDAEVAQKVVNTPSEEKLGQLVAALDFIFEKGQYGVAMLPHRLAKRFFEATKSMKDVTVYGDFGTNVRVPNVTINVKGYTAEEVKKIMRQNHIAIKAGTFDAPRLAKSLGIEENGAARFSFGYFNKRMEVNDAIWVLMQMQGLTDLYYLA